MSRNIKKVFYKKERINDIVNYELFFTRHISGKDRDISYSKESCGIQNLTLLLPYFLAAANGKVVLIDEFDNGIHDILLSNMLKALNRDITGQVIISTHNTQLLNEYAFKDSFYFIEVDANGNRIIRQPSDFDYRIQPDSNVMLNYLQSRFNTIPWHDIDINYNDIVMTSADSDS